MAPRIPPALLTAEPARAQYNPIKTIKTSVMGTMYMLGLAKRVRARILLASAGEVEIVMERACWWRMKHIMSLFWCGEGQ